jgi:hypothetical protein
MKINSKDFRVQPGLSEELRDEKTIWEERYRSIRDLERHLYRNGTRTLKVRCRQGRRHPARHVRSQSARLPGLQFQTAER